MGMCQVGMPDILQAVTASQATLVAITALRDSWPRRPWRPANQPQETRGGSGWPLHSRRSKGQVLWRRRRQI